MTSSAPPRPHPGGAGHRRSTETATDVPTRHGRAVAHVHAVDRPTGVLVLGHGAGGGVAAPDLVAVTAAATAVGWSVVLVEQPYRAAGRKAPPRAPVLDEAWVDVVEALRRQEVAGLTDDTLPGRGSGVPLVTGGRSAGARVACRTAMATGATGVVALAFPAQPPGRPDLPSRLPELAAAGVPTLVVQGATDPYGTPPSAPGREVVVVPGDHGLKRDPAAVADAVAAWLGRLRA